MEGIKIVSKNEDWDIEPFERIYSKIRKANYTNEWIWKIPVKSVDRKKVISELPEEFALC